MTARAGWLWIIAALVTALMAFAQQRHASDLRQELAGLEEDIAQRREVVRVLAAEWSYLSRPERIKDLARRHLADLKPLTVHQLWQTSGIPLAPPPMSIGTARGWSQAAEEGL